MPIINFTNPVITLVALILFLLVLYLGKETKKAWVVGVFLFVFLGILTGHAIEFTILSSNIDADVSEILLSAIVDFLFILLSFISYLWVDHQEIELGKKKSIDDSLDWFWKKI